MAIEMALRGGLQGGTATRASNPEFLEMPEFQLPLVRQRRAKRLWNLRSHPRSRLSVGEEAKPKASFWRPIVEV